jgi:signal transduction histidine kinase
MTYLSPVRRSLRDMGRPLRHRIESPWSAADPAPAGRRNELPADERRRIAREIHDRVGNSISLALRHLELAEVYRAQRRPDADEKLVETRRMLLDAMDITRQLVSDLRPEKPVGDLGRALRAFVREVERPDVTVEVLVEGDEAALPIRCRDELFVIAREGLRNAFSHARPRRVIVLVGITPRTAYAVVEDDGVGFDADPAGGAAGTGLLSMRERTELLGGTFALMSRPFQGTRIEVAIPLGEDGDVGPH